MQKLLIAPINFHHDLLLKYRKDNPFSDIKIMSKEELIREWKGSFEKEAIIHLMKKYSYSYEYIKALLPFLIYADSNNSHLFPIKEDLLEQGLLVKNEYLNTFLNNKKTYIYGYSTKDIELTNFLKAFGINHQFIANKERVFNDNVLINETTKEETLCVLNEVARLIDNGVDINDICIYVNDNDYLAYLERFGEDFGFKTDIVINKPLFLYPIAKSFLNSYKASKDINLALFDIEVCSDKELLLEFKDIISNSISSELTFEQQLDYFIGVLKDTKYTHKKYKNCLKIIDSPIFKENCHIFVMGFAQGNFPSSYKDNLLLSDKEKELLGMNTSVQRTEISQEMTLDFFYSNNHFYFSRSKRSLSNTYIDSPWLNKLGLKNTTREFPEFIYSKKMLDFYHLKYLDLEKNYSEITNELIALDKISNVEYSTYKNDFTGASVFDDKQKMEYSYSQINTYYQCPFSYYVGRVLGIDPFEGNFNTEFGKVAHSIFEHHHDKNFDFDKAYDSLVKQGNFTDEDYPILNNLKKQVREASEAIKLHERHMKNPKVLTEKFIKYPLTKQSDLVGVIDKSIILDDKFLVIVDYKTGNDSFSDKDLEKGVGMQLPTYNLLASGDPILKNYRILGLFINNVIDTSLSHEPFSESLINPFYRLNGKLAVDVDDILIVDDTIANDKSEFIKGVIKAKTGGYQSKSTISSFEEINRYGEIVKGKYLEADERIRNNEFPINPLFKKKNDGACKYCTYRDICYVKSNQKRMLNELDNSDETEDEDE